MGVLIFSMPPFCLSDLLWFSKGCLLHASHMLMNTMFCLLLLINVAVIWEAKSW